ncbi:MAG: histidine kinase, partial [Flavobacteriaceae bacterium]
MTTSLLKAVCVILCSLLNANLIFSQIIANDSEKSYNKVFVDTDNFGLSYLDTLENAYMKVDTDSVKFSILNDLGYYWHTRNLIKASEFNREGLVLAVNSQDSLWEGRFQITQGAILLRMEALDSAMIVLNSAIKKVTPADLPFLYTQIGYVYERKGQIDKAADFALEALQLGVELGDT